MARKHPPTAGGIKKPHRRPIKRKSPSKAKKANEAKIQGESQRKKRKPETNRKKTGKAEQNEQTKVQIPLVFCYGRDLDGICVELRRATNMEPLGANRCFMTFVKLDNKGKGEKVKSEKKEEKGRVVARIGQVVDLVDLYQGTNGGGGGLHWGFQGCQGHASKTAEATAQNPVLHELQQCASVKLGGGPEGPEDYVRILLRHHYWPIAYFSPSCYQYGVSVTGQDPEESLGSQILKLKQRKGKAVAVGSVWPWATHTLVDFKQLLGERVVLKAVKVVQV